MGRTSQARERLIEATWTLMRGRGYGAIGVAQICAQADVRKGSFYYYFESKQALTAVAVAQAWSDERRRWMSALETNGSSLARLEALFVAQRDMQVTSKKECGAVAGCLYANLALEMGPGDDLVRQQLADVFDDQVAIVLAVLEAAAREGAVDEGRVTAETARALLAQMEGQVMFAKLRNDPRLLEGWWDQARSLLVAAPAEKVRPRR
jgi:TetR/AcrR family transcriptional regulator, transcriptional repressor for nem operon